MSKPRSSLQKMVQLLFPNLHESLIRIGCESGHELVAGWSDACVAVSNVRKTFIAIWGKLNFQATSRYSRDNLQHLNKPVLWFVTCHIPNRLAGFRRDENAITLSNARGSDNQIWQPIFHPLGLSHRAQKRKDSRGWGAQSLPVGVCRPIWLCDAHGGLTKPS